MLRHFRLARQCWAIALFFAFGVAQAESLTCSEEQGLELVSSHQAELTAPAGDAPDGAVVHCCACIHTFVSTARRLDVTSATPTPVSAFLFHPQVLDDRSPAPLTPPPIA